VLRLAQQGMTQRDIASLLHISQPTVTRRIREGVEARKTQRMLVTILVLATLFTLSVMAIAAALGTLAWG